MQDPGGFLPKSIPEWIGAIAVLGGWIVSVSVVWTKTTDKINGLGDRVNKLEAADATKDGKMSGYEREHADIRRAVGDLNRAIQDGATRLGRVEQAVEGIDDHLTGMELKLVNEMSKLREIISERDSKLRERVARIESNLRMQAPSDD